MTEEREVDLYFGKAIDNREDELFEQARQRRIDAEKFYEQAVRVEMAGVREAA